MPFDDFEQLIFELVHREEPRARRLSPPDDGADTMLDAEEGRAAKVWQAKHYPGSINWAKCRESLSAALVRWSPSEVVFVFPRDLSAVQEAGFKKHLVEQADAEASGARIGVWNLSELVRRLNEHDDLRVRFFGPEQEQLMDVLNRTTSAGGSLETPQDLVERARTLSDWAERQDKRFIQEVRSGGLEVPAPNWERLPHMMLRIADTSTQVSIAAWPREGATVAPTLFGFHDNEAGQGARMAAVERLARGEPADVTEGAQVQMDAPEIIRALAPEERLGEPAFTLNPGEPVTLEIEATNDEGTFTRSVDLYNVPPPPGAAGTLAGYSGSVLLQMTIRLLEEPRRVSARGVSPCGRGGGSPARPPACEGTGLG